jgi:hypothetical protein
MVPRNDKGVCIVFSECGFLLGEDNSIVIVIPAHLPEAENYTVTITPENIKFRAGYNDVAELRYPGGELFKRLAHSVQVGLVEYEPGIEDMPKNFTNLAYIEVRRSM